MISAKSPKRPLSALLRELQKSLAKLGFFCLKYNKKPRKSSSVFIWFRIVYCLFKQVSLAEAVGFEPTDGENRRRFSRPVHSTTLPHFRIKRPLRFLTIRTRARQESRRKEPS